MTFRKFCRLLILNFIFSRDFNMTDHFSMKQENSEIEEMSAEIKKEPQEFKDLSESRNPENLGNADDFKEEISDPENKIDKNENLDIEEDKPLRKKRHKKKSRKVFEQSFPEPPAGLGSKYLDFFFSRSLKMREKYVSFTQLVLLSLYIF